MKLKTRSKSKSNGSDCSIERAQLEAIVLHAIRREYPYLLQEHQRHQLTDNVASGNEQHAQVQQVEVELSVELLTAFLDASAERLASLTANWLRVGFAQVSEKLYLLLFITPRSTCNSSTINNGG